HHQLTPDDQFVMARGNRYSSDGEWFTYAAATKGDGSLLERSRVYIARADGTDARTLAIGSEESRTFVKDWHPADRQLLVYDTATTTRCGVYDIQTETLTWFGTGDIQEKPVVWLPDGERFLAIRKAHITTTPIVYDCQTGQAHELAVGGSCSYAPTATDELVIDAHHVLIPRSTPTIPTEVLSYDLQTDTTTTLLRTSDGAVEPSRLVDPEYITYESTDGRSIGALLYRTSKQPSPAIVLVHGGRHGRASEDYHWPSQLLVDRGFTVLRPNYRGSSGRGRAFKQLQYGDLGGHDAMDVAAGGQWLRRQDLVDGDRIAVYGASYGGYLTYVQMV
ncbi:alpha/beta hydrolase family protein, partial [Halocatena pleomorpha]